MTTHHQVALKVCFTLFVATLLWLITQPLPAKGLGAVSETDSVTNTFDKLVDKEGNVRLPDNYRQAWGHMGSWTVLDDSAPGYGFHDVYVQQDAIDTYREKGRFPDGSVLIKEVRKVLSGPQTTGHAQWAGDLKIKFVMVKDEMGRFSGNKHWKEGWGWMLYEAQNPLTNVSQGFKETCFACHAPAKETDWVFVNGYPSLRK